MMGNLFYPKITVLLRNAYTKLCTGSPAAFYLNKLEPGNKKAGFQRTFALQASFGKSERELFLDRMEQVVPWINLQALMTC